MLSRFLSFLIVGLLLVFTIAPPALASGGVGGDVISVYVFSVDQAVAAISTESRLQDPTRQLYSLSPSEAVIYVAVLFSTERGGVVLCGYTCSVSKLSGPSNYSIVTRKSGAPLHYWFKA